MGAGSVWKKALIALIVICAIYYPVGMIWSHRINDDPAFAIDPATLTPQQSQAVANAAALIDREVNQTSWVANNPFFFWNAPLDNMPNYQQGIIAAVSRFAVAMEEQLGRVRGSSAADSDLQEAAGLLKYPGTRWHYDLTVSWAPTATSESQYRKARRELLDYNDRLGSGNAVFERRADNLLATIDRFALDLGAESAAIDQAIKDRAWVVDTNADDVFYRVKGKAYGYYILLLGLQHDFDRVIAEREIGNIWPELLKSLEEVIRLDPVVVTNGAPDAMLWPSHLAAQGFYVLRARTQLRELSNVLLR